MVSLPSIVSKRRIQRFEEIVQDESQQKNMEAEDDNNIIIQVDNEEEKEPNSPERVDDVKRINSADSGKKLLSTVAEDEKEHEN